MSYDYRDVLSDPEIPEDLSTKDVFLLLDTVLKETFFKLFERAFGKPNPEVMQKVEEANVLQVQEWITNFIGAQKPDDVFVDPLARDIARFAAGVINRKHGGNIDPNTIHKLEDLQVHMKDLDDKT